MQRRSGLQPLKMFDNNDIIDSLKGLFLCDISPSDSRWDERKRDSVALATEMEKIGHNRYAERIRGCSGWLEFTLTDGGYKLKSARFCRVRWCPICQWRKSRMWVARFVEAYPSIEKDYPTSKFLFLTLTVKNCESSDLKATLKHLNQSFARLTQRKQWPGQGWVKSIEITRGEDDSAHPHIHCLLMVPSRYFSEKYLSHAKWVELWKRSARLDYEPIVNIKTIKIRNPAPPSATIRTPPSAYPGGHLVLGAIVETIKYAVKPEELLVGGQWLTDLIQATCKSRSVSLGGCFPKYFKADEGDETDEDMIHTGLQPDSSAKGESLDVFFGYHEWYGKYRIAG